MAINYDKSGASMSIPAPEDVLSGQAVMFGDIIVGIAQSDALEGEICVFAIEGVWTVPSEGAAHDEAASMTFNPASGAFHADTPAAGQLAQAGMAFSPGGGTAETVEVNINVHQGEFEVVE